MLVMYLGWKFIKKTKFVHLDEMDLVTDVHTAEEQVEEEKGWTAKAKGVFAWLF